MKQWLSAAGYEFEDLGAHKYDPQDDYPDFVHPVAQKVSQDPENNRGIILGASGQGEAMTANRYSGVRAAVYYGGPDDIVKLSREHNDANVLSVGAAPGSTIEEGKPLDDDTAKHIILTWLAAPFSGDDRHVRRIKKIEPE